MQYQILYGKPKCGVATEFPVGTTTLIILNPFISVCEDLFFYYLYFTGA